MARRLRSVAPPTGAVLGKTMPLGHRSQAPRRRSLSLTHRLLSLSLSGARGRPGKTLLARASLLGLLALAGTAHPARAAAPSPVIRTVDVGGHAVAGIAVDTAARRAFVLAEGGEGAHIYGLIGVLDAASGTLLRRVRLAGIWPRALAVDPRARRLFVLSAAAPLLPGTLRSPHPLGSLLVLDERTLTARRTVTVGQEPFALHVDARRHRVLVLNGPIYGYRGSLTAASGLWNTVSVLDSRTGAPRRTIALGGETTASALDERTGHLWTTTLLAQAAGDVGRVQEVDPGSGALLHRVPVSNRVRVLALGGTPARVVAGDPVNRTVSVIDAATGALLRTTVLPDGPEDILVDGATGHVVVGGSTAVFGGTPPAGPAHADIYQFAARDGRLLHTVPLSRRLRAVTTVSLALDTQAGHLWAFVDSDSALRLLDRHSGRVVRTVPLHSYGAYGTILAVDSVSHRAYMSAFPPGGPANSVALVRT